MKPKLVQKIHREVVGAIVPAGGALAAAVPVGADQL